MSLAAPIIVRRQPRRQAEIREPPSGRASRADERSRISRSEPARSSPVARMSSTAGRFWRRLCHGHAMNRLLMGIGLVLLLTAFAGAAPLAFAGLVLVVIAVEREAKRIREEARRAVEEEEEQESIH